MTEFRAENWGKVSEEIIRYWPEHYQEAYNDDEYNPDFEKYATLAISGALLVVTARRGPELVGYSVSFIQPHPHQMHLLWGSFDSYWVKREARGPGVVVRLLKASIAEMKKLGVKRVLGIEPKDGRIFAHLDFRAGDQIWLKDI